MCDYCLRNDMTDMWRLRSTVDVMCYMISTIDSLQLACNNNVLDIQEQLQISGSTGYLAELLTEGA